MSNKKVAMLRHSAYAEGDWKTVLSNNVATASVGDLAVQLPRQGRQGMRSKITLNIKVSQAGAIVVAMHVTETCETSLDNGNRDLLKLKLQETWPIKNISKILSLHFHIPFIITLLIYKRVVK